MQILKLRPMDKNVSFLIVRGDETEARLLIEVFYKPDLFVL